LNLWSCHSEQNSAAAGAESQNPINRSVFHAAGGDAPATAS
jgi:hypothetical protein